MSDFQRINAARPGKIIDMLDVIDASARSQRATPEDVHALLAPVYERLGIGAQPQPQPQPQPALPPTTRPLPRGVVAQHDGLDISAMNACLRRSTPDQVRAALEWCIARG